MPLRVIHISNAVHMIIQLDGTSSAMKASGSKIWPSEISLRLIWYPGEPWRVSVPGIEEVSVFQVHDGDWLPLPHLEVYL